MKYTLLKVYIIHRRFVDLWSDLITYSDIEMRSVILTFILCILQLAGLNNKALDMSWRDRYGY